jgi:hypothetical protein
MARVLANVPRLGGVLSYNEASFGVRAASAVFTSSWFPPSSGPCTEMNCSYGALAVIE